MAKKNWKPKKQNKISSNLVLADVHFAVTQFGFDYGDAKVERVMSDDRKGWVVIGIKSRRKTIHIYITKTGKIRVMTYGGKEWAEAK